MWGGGLFVCFVFRLFFVSSLKIVITSALCCGVSVSLQLLWIQSWWARALKDVVFGWGNAAFNVQFHMDSVSEHLTLLVVRSWPFAMMSLLYSCYKVLLVYCVLFLFFWIPSLCLGLVFLKFAPGTFVNPTTHLLEVLHHVESEHLHPSPDSEPSSLQKHLHSYL